MPFNQITRRSALGAAATLALPMACQFPGSNPQSRRLLVLGGTRFLGPPIVRAALAAGWSVTLFNRGKSGKGLFPELERRIGDRNELDYASLQEGEWDAVIDTSAYVPEHVRVVAELLAGRVGHYNIISTVSVYAEEQESTGPRDEDSALATISQEQIEATKKIQQVTGETYGALKVLCEDAMEEVFKDNCCIVRPGLIVGPGDSSERFTYWPARLARGGEVLAPGGPKGDGSQEVQLIDVEDLGHWIFELTARQVQGTFNALGYPEPLSMHDMLATCQKVAHNDARLTWVPDEFLLEQEVGQWMELPLWIAGGGHQFSLERALKQGLTFSSIEDTTRRTLDWHLATNGPEHEFRRTGIATEKESKVLAAWHESQGAETTTR
ncbi:MAG TPA: NAD-dependent epimerase/dehydratase family protein [Planctomycetes bacterium]|nr:NAD-dependent epimerase/dehydratase family protein [Planctomycetota bacterium]HIL36451.1 NAD-dependent epimerase/dehydratase family protein [Planctomycetota bacterium]